MERPLFLWNGRELGASPGNGRLRGITGPVGCGRRHRCRYALHGQLLPQWNLRHRITPKVETRVFVVGAVLLLVSDGREQVIRNKCHTAVAVEDNGDTVNIMLVEGHQFKIRKTTNKKNNQLGEKQDHLFDSQQTCIYIFTMAFIKAQNKDNLVQLYNLNSTQSGLYNKVTRKWISYRKI